MMIKIGKNLVSNFFFLTISNVFGTTCCIQHRGIWKRCLIEKLSRDQAFFFLQIMDPVNGIVSMSVTSYLLSKYNLNCHLVLLYVNFFLFIDVLKSQLRLYAVFSLGFPAGLMISIRDGAQLLFNSLKRSTAVVLVIFLQRLAKTVLLVATDEFTVIATL